jgi:cytochrome P450
MSEWDTSDPFAEARRGTGILEGDFDGERIPLILRYRDVQAAAADYSTFSSDTPFRVPIPSEESVRQVRQLPIESDPPSHSDYRAIVQPFFAAPRRPEVVAKVNRLVGNMVDEVAGSGPVEVVERFALPLQSRALALLLNMPMSEADEWIGWGQHVFQGEAGHSAEKGDVLDDYLHRQLDRAEANPEDDFFSALVKAEFRGRPLSREEMVGFGNLVFAGGRDTVIATVSLALAHLALHPEDFAKLRAEPGTVPRAVEEIVRIASPLTLIGRTCPKGTGLSGSRVRAGSRVAICWASANRDESVFEEPDTLWIDRPKNPHVAFGLGPHRCLGASHARLVLRTLLEQVCRRAARLELVESRAKYEVWPAYRRQTGFEKLWIRFEAGR